MYYFLEFHIGMNDKDNVIYYLQYLLNIYKKNTICNSNNKHKSDKIQKRCERREERSYPAVTLRNC